MSNKLIEFYNTYLNHFDVTNPSSVGWTDRDNQYGRFEALFRIGIRNNDKVLDYGCGLGHLNDYIKEVGLEDIDYLGIDINPNYIDKAKSLYPDKNFMVGVSGDINSVNDVDYIIGSGVFTVNTTLEQIYNVVKLSYDKANKGVAFNFLTKESGLHPLNTYDKDQIHNLLSKIGKVDLLYGYLGNEDFTIHIKK